jgi:DNA-binding CsgD family transcriptional regulator
MPRVDHKALEAASVRLGEAVLDPSLWPELMDGVCRAIDATGAILLQTDVQSNSLAVPFTESIRDTIERYFASGWYLRDPRARGISLLMTGLPVYADADIFTPEQRRKDPYYNEVAVPGGIDWFAAIGFRSGPALWALCMQRNSRQGPFNDQEKRVLARLAIPLSEIATLSKAVGRVALASGMNALAEVRHPAIAIDHFGFVLDANEAMEEILGEDIGVNGKRLVVADPDAASAVERLVAGLATLDGVSVGLGPVVIRRQARSPVIVRALPVPPAAQSPFLGARAILTFTALEPKPRPVAALLAQTFGLTAAEAKLAAALATGARLEAVAEELGISRHTARSQLKAVFAKTGTHRQSQLVALLARL